jgi:hypothetical protein
MTVSMKLDEDHPIHEPDDGHTTYSAKPASTMEPEQRVEQSSTAEDSFDSRRHEKRRW